MDDIVRNEAEGSSREREELVKGLAQRLSEEKGQNTVALTLRGHSSWTDYFVITTGNSQAHMNGLQEAAGEFAAAEGLELRSGYKKMQDQPWILMDCGDVVVHIMSQQAREFYRLEECWFQAGTLYQSSKSS